MKSGHPTLSCLWAVWPQTFKKNKKYKTMKHQNCDLAADIPKHREDHKTTQHQNCDLAADITNKSKLKPISKIESTIWPHTSKFVWYLKRTTLRGAQTSNPYIIN